MSLVDYLNSIEEQDEEMSKVAAEEDAAGRIMARGFMDELNKIAQQYERVAPMAKGLLSQNPGEGKPETLLGGHTYRNTGDMHGRAIPSEGISRTMQRPSIKRSGKSLTLAASKKSPGPHPSIRKALKKDWK